MRILVVQESDWIEVGTHDIHHLMERLAVLGDEIRVIDFEIRWHQREHGDAFSRRKVIFGVHKVVEEAQITIIRPPIMKLPILDYLSLIVTHWFEIRRQIKEFKPDLIIGLGILNTKFASNLANKNGIPFIHYLLDELHRLVPQKYLSSLAKTIERSNLRNADIIIVTNNALKDYAISMGANEERTIVLPHGVDVKKYGSSNQRKRIREEYQLNDNDIVLFFMGWLYESSGLDILAKALIESNIPNMKLMIVGKGELWDRLQEISKEEKGARKIILVGWKDYREIADMISASDICILPSKRVEMMENIVPIKILEYMAAGRPVIVTDLPGIRKEFGENNGILYVDDCRGIPRFSKELTSSNALEHYGSQARIRASQNDWPVIMERFKSISGEAIARVGKPPRSE